MDMAARYTEATEIIRKLGEYERAGKRAYAWRKAWLVRRDSLRSGLLAPGAPLRKIPGLRYSRILSVTLQGLREDPVEIPTDADAIQVGHAGSRLRSFMVAKKKTLKVVRESSHYGPATLREIDWRTQIGPHGLLVPRLDAHEAQGGYLFVHEELVEGRAFHMLRDRRLIVGSVLSPLAAFYEKFGMQQMPLDKALGPLPSFLRSGKWQAPAALLRLVERNPSVSVSLCHNDLLPSNLAVSSKGVYFLDWGLASYSICGRDFAKICYNSLENKGIRAAAEALVNRLQGGRITLDELVAIDDAFTEYKLFHRNGRLDTGIHGVPA